MKTQDYRKKTPEGKVDAGQLTGSNSYLAFWILFWIELSILVLFAYTLIKRFNESNLSDSETNSFIYITIGLIVSYFLFYQFRILSEENKKTSLSSFLSILIIYSTLLIGLAIYNPKPPVLLIPDIKSGTFGLRTWECCVDIPYKSLKVFYMDQNEHWKQIPESLIRNEKNWVKYQFIDDPKLSDEFDFRATFWNEKIELKNCAIIFYPENAKDRMIYDDIMVESKFVFAEIGEENCFPGFNILTMVDTIYDIDVNNLMHEKRKFSELCIQFNINVFDEAHPWIPVLDRYASILNKSSKSYIKTTGYYPPLKKDTTYHVSAIVLKDQVILAGHDNHGSCTLYETQISSNKY